MTTSFSFVKKHALLLLSLAFLLVAVPTHAQDNREDCLAEATRLEEVCASEVQTRAQICFDEATTTEEEEDICNEEQNRGFSECDTEHAGRVSFCETLPSLEEADQNYLNNDGTCRFGVQPIYGGCLYADGTPVEPERTIECQFGVDAFGECRPDPATQAGAGTTQRSISDQYESIRAQGIIFGNICQSRNTPCPCRDTGDCTLNNVLQVIVNIAVFILGISGTIVLAMFVYGGFLWLTSEGRPEMVNKGKQTMVGAVVGLMIIFGSYAAITFLINALRFGSAPSSGTNLEDVLEESVGPAAGETINTVE